MGHDQLAFLISPGDVPFANLSASGLAILNEEGRPISGGKGVDEVAAVLHAASYLAKDDVKSVLLLRSTAAVLVSRWRTCRAMKLRMESNELNKR